ncbi:MAG: cell division ATP-binding protein FtsE [Clostridia bacterium]|nr:cell division ATP-binding protein FtsE [Clostridia bacterium]
MIEFKNVSKIYDNGTKALKNVNLRIDRGEFVFIVGSSGSGKSTLLKTIMREEAPTSGKITINNYDLVDITKKEIPYFRRTMGIVFQDFRLIPKMSVYDNVAFAMRVIGTKEKEIRKRVPYVLSLVGLTSKARSFPNEISGGEQQRVALARALVNNANIIIADEPTGNIDPEMSYEIIDLLNHINANGTTVILVTHEHDLVHRFNHRIVAIENGSIISDTANGDRLDYDVNRGYKRSFYPTQQNNPISPQNSNRGSTFNMPQAAKPVSSDTPLQGSAVNNTRHSQPKPNNEVSADLSAVGIDYSKYLEHLENIDETEVQG